jgi:DNA-binding NtrC family response regulator
VLSPRNLLTPSDLGFTADQIRNDVNLKVAKKAIELEFLNKALTRNHGIVSRAARELGISRVNLYELIEKYNLRLQEFKIVKAAKSPMKIREVS